MNRRRFPPTATGSAAALAAAALTLPLDPLAGAGALTRRALSLQPQ